MKTKIFFNEVTSEKLNESFAKQFGGRVKFEKYTREELEDIRNKLRTRVFQHEGSSGYNDLLTNETYQKDKAMLQLINTRIKEMIGEDIKKLRDKMTELSEAKKGVLAPKFKKHPKGAKGTGGKDQTGDGKTDFDDIQVARMTAGGVPKKQAIAKATSDKFEEDRKVQGTRYGGGRQTSKPEHDDEQSDDTTKSDKGHASITSTEPGKYGDAHSREERAKHKAEKSKIPGRVIKGKAGSLAQKDKDDDKMEEATERKAEVKPSKGMTAKEKSAAVKQAKSGKDMGKPGKGFEKIEKAAGGGEKGKKIAGAAFWKGQAAKVKESNEIFRQNVRIVNESLRALIAEDQEEKAKAITAASDMVNDFTSWMQRVGQYQTKAVIELSDAIKADFGAEQAEAFKAAVGPALSATLEVLTQQRETISNAVAALAGDETAAMGPPEAMGAPSPEVAPDMMNTGDEFAASDAAAGGETASGREVRESFARKLAESHSIIAKLAK